MPQEQLCDCGHRSGTNSDCMECRFVSTEQRIRSEVVDLRRKLTTQADELKHKFRTLSACPPDTDLEHWLGVLRRHWEEECEKRVG